MNLATVKISRVGLEGQGVGFDDAGNIYFVPRALPGDTVKIRFPETTKKYRDAELVEVVEPSGQRVEPVCSYFQVCGGCDWLQWDYAAQIEAKAATLAHVFERGALTPLEIKPVVIAEKTLGYRNRIQVRRKGDVVGFYQKLSRDLVDVKSCAVASPKINEALAQMREEPAPAELSKIELYVDKAGEVHRFDNSRHSVGGFAQIHAEQNEKLRAIVAQTMKEVNAKKVLELFCGDGNLTTAYLPLVDRVWAVDSVEASIELARAEKPADLAASVAYFVDRVDGGLYRRLPEDARNYDTLVIDPPRTGMAGALEKFLHPGLKAILYVSCSPVTFSQDVQCLKNDFQFVRLTQIDMFPHTKHIELVALFLRS